MSKKSLLILVSVALAVLFGGIVYEEHREANMPAVSFFGFLRSVKGDMLSIDEVQFLSGEEARRLAAQDTGCPVKTVQDCIPSLENDFYIRNTDKTEHVYVLASNASVSILSHPGGPDLASTTAKTFLVIFPRSNRLQPFLFVRKGDTVIEAVEQYTP